MRVLDVVATLREFPDQRVGKGQVGTVVDELDHDHVLVEFSDLDGVAFAIEPIAKQHLMRLKYAPDSVQKNESEIRFAKLKRGLIHALAATRSRHGEHRRESPLLYSKYSLHASA